MAIVAHSEGGGVQGRRLCRVGLLATLRCVMEKWNVVVGSPWKACKAQTPGGGVVLGWRLRIEKRRDSANTLYGSSAGLVHTNFTILFWIHAALFFRGGGL